MTTEQWFARGVVRGVSVCHASIVPFATGTVGAAVSLELLDDEQPTMTIAEEATSPKNLQNGPVDFMRGVL